MRFHSQFRALAAPIAAGLMALFMSGAEAAPSLVSVAPVRGAAGVATNTTIVFTFSEPMDRDVTDATFYGTAFPPEFWVPDSAWSANDTVLTYSNTDFPPNKTVNWVVSGQSKTGEELGTSPLPIGTFTTGTGGGQNPPTGSGTNRITSFIVGVGHFYDQTNATTPVAWEFNPYSFTALVTLASNRTASAITVTPPGSTPRNLDNFSSPEFYLFSEPAASASYIDMTYPQGNYAFNVTAATSNQQVTVNLPAPSQQPNVPVIANYQALQNINPAQDLTISWNTFQGGSDANARIHVDFGGITNSAQFDEVAALPGTATSFKVPAALLSANSNYTVTVGFYRINATTNSSEYRAAYRTTWTFLEAHTAGTNGPVGGTVPFNIFWSGNAIGFDIDTTPGQTLIVETNATLHPSAWGTYYTTNAPGNRIRFLENNFQRPRLFYRARSGS